MDIRICPKCRDYDLERSWCDVCNGAGIVREDQSDIEQIKRFTEELRSKQRPLGDNFRRVETSELWEHFL